jgi:hypothetical protein
MASIRALHFGDPRRASEQFTNHSAPAARDQINFLDSSSRSAMSSISNVQLSHLTNNLNTIVGSNNASSTISSSEEMVKGFFSWFRTILLIYGHADTKSSRFKPNNPLIRAINIFSFVWFRVTTSPRLDRRSAHRSPEVARQLSRRIC